MEDYRILKPEDSEFIERSKIRRETETL